MLAEFQRALADMTLDVRLTVAVRAGERDALAGYELTDRERRRLEDVARQDGMSLNCSLARANRFGSIHDAFPMTCVLLGPHLRTMLDELWSANRPGNYQLTGEEMVFAALVRQALERGDIDDQYLAEIFGYEQVCWEMAMEVRLHDLAAAEGCTRTCRFDHDPAPLLDALARHELPPPDVPRGDYRVSISVRDGDLVAEWAAGPPAKSGEHFD